MEDGLKQPKENNNFISEAIRWFKVDIHTYNMFIALFTALCFSSDAFVASCAFVAHFSNIYLWHVPSYLGYLSAAFVSNHYYYANS